jgi:Ca-activated chloride channel family protein
MLLPPVTASMPAATPRELVFVIDTSGSMGGASIEQARAALHFGIDRLTGIDRFNIIEFNSTARAVYAAPTAFSAATLDQAHRFVDGLRANGGTNIASALGVALAGAPAPGYLRQIVFITDGSVGNEAELFRLITERLGDSRLFTVGIGSAPNSHFMRKAAQFGRGTQLHIARADEVATAMGRLFDRLGQVALREIRVDWPFAVEAYPERIPDLYRGEPVIVAARLGSGIAGTIPVTLTGQSGSFSWSEDIAIVPGASAGVASIWARRKIESLQDRRLEGVAEASIRPQVVEVALTHRLLSPYTSLVAVDRTPELTRTAALRREALGNLAPAGSEAGARFAMLAATATDARLLQFVGVLLTGLVLGLLGIWRLTRRLPG